jgi:hypothetical protein
MELGQAVTVAANMLRTGAKPHMTSLNHDRYRRNVLVPPRKGVWVGKRSIHTEGYTTYDSDEGYYFVPKKTVGVNLVAISARELLYVLDEDISES